MKLTISLPKTLLAAIKAEAKSRGISASELVRQTIKNATK
jgi:metal-responsive CopG/Arc/MetJ family transcriptional regulator